MLRNAQKNITQCAFLTEQEKSQAQAKNKTTNSEQFKDDKTRNSASHAQIRKNGAAAANFKKVRIKRHSLFVLEKQLIS